MDISDPMAVPEDDKDDNTRGDFEDTKCVIQ
jgi:hypothetical protein